MRKIFTYILPALLLMGACASEKREFRNEGGDGVATLNLKFDDAVETDSRTIISDESLLTELNSSAKVRIYNSENNLVRLYEGMDKVPAQISLMADAYMLSVTAGTLTHAGFNKPYYTGSIPFIIEKGDIKSVSLTCKVANTLLSVAFDSSLERFFDLSTAKVLATTEDTQYGLTYTTETTDKGYFMFDDDNTTRNIMLTFTAKTLTNENLEYSYSIANAKAATEYGVTIKYSEPVKPEEGGAGIDIEINEQVVNKDNSLQIVERPRLSGGESFNITMPIYFEPNSGSRTVVWLTTASQLKSFTVTSDVFTAMGLSATSYDMHKLSDEDKTALDALGLSFDDYRYNATNGQSSGKLVFTDEFMQWFDTDGEYVFNLAASDNVNNLTEQNLNFVVSSATVAALDVDMGTVYSNRAILKGEIVDEDRATGPYTFKYKPINGDEWSTVSATLETDGITLTASISNLSPLTAYHFRAVDNGIEGMVTKAFTTEDAAQLPNSGFEYWADNVPGANSDALTLTTETGSLYWDCGNHGSNTMKKLVTNPDSDIRPGSTGSKSSKMVSQFVGIGTIGKFAAGNMFVGRYAATDGTDGVLDWGRPFECRPSAFEFWFKYAPGVLEKNTIPSGVNVDNLSVGSSDIGQIYVAIGDWDSPVTIKTKNSTSGGGQLFDFNDPHIIALGKYDMKSAVASWTNIKVPMEYRVSDRKPTYIIVTISASKYGDYFTGGEGSTLYMDDFSLIYE